ncbi:hypothetical protein E4S40_10725 [Algoriphagus kandeliae]|uniref:Uncharacterized protein n=1 Tax=Algoriphagus kandeliae TaxID=2562278 RepID=A0A4Y9QQL4_9BACT|nr:hypothetical protein [Algoriphagus kandeliae]TFV94487.1 hypothetical protein E4S40_10725 [Algoriphagus kandeliae]
MKDSPENQMVSKEIVFDKQEIQLSIKQLMEEFAELEYQFFLEKNERSDAASENPNLEIGNNTNQETAA